MCHYDGCEKRFYKAKARREHEKSAHEGNGLKCDHCEKSFVTSAKTSLMRHMLIKHGISVECSKCAKSFVDFNCYVTHRRQICNKKSHFKQAYHSKVERLGEPHPKVKGLLKALSGESKCSVPNSSSGLIFVKIRAESGRIFSENPGKIRAKIRAKLNFVILSSFYDLGHVQTGILRFGEQLHNALNVH